MNPTHSSESYLERTMRLYTVAEMMGGRGRGLGGRKRGVGRHRLQVIVAAARGGLCDCGWGRR